MTEAPASTSTEDGLSVLWKLSDRRSRKSGCSNIFTGMNLHQLYRLFRAAGERDAEHRAKLVWQGMGGEIERAEKEQEEEGKQIEVEVGLAQALVGLRVRARNRAGIRADGHKDHKRLRASRYLRTDSVGVEQTDLQPSSGAFLLAADEDIPENEQRSSSDGVLLPQGRTSAWRLGVARQDGARHSEHYLHRIVH